MVLLCNNQGCITIAFISIITLLVSGKKIHIERIQILNMWSCIHIYCILMPLHVSSNYLNRNLHQNIYLYIVFSWTPAKAGPPLDGLTFSEGGLCQNIVQGTLLFNLSAHSMSVLVQQGAQGQSGSNSKSVPC